jgi:hypothetical protein
LTLIKDILDVVKDIVGIIKTIRGQQRQWRQQVSFCCLFYLHYLYTNFYLDFSKLCFSPRAYLFRHSSSLHSSKYSSYNPYIIKYTNITIGSVSSVFWGRWGVEGGYLGGFGVVVLLLFVAKNQISTVFSVL